MSKPKPCSACDGLMSANATSCQVCYYKGLEQKKKDGVPRRYTKLGSEEKKKLSGMIRAALDKYKKELDKKRITNEF